MNFLRYAILSSVLLLLLSQGLVSQPLPVTPTSSEQLEIASIELLNIADQIESYQSRASDLMSKISDLEKQKQGLNKDKSDYLLAYQELETALTSYQVQVKLYQDKVRTLQGNFAGLLTLSKTLRTKLELSGAINSIILPVTIVAIAAVVIETIIIANNSTAIFSGPVTSKGFGLQLKLERLPWK